MLLLLYMGLPNYLRETLSCPDTKKTHVMLLPKGELFFLNMSITN